MDTRWSPKAQYMASAGASEAVKITKRMVDGAGPRVDRYVIWDTELKGFGLRVEPSGIKSFIVRYRAGQGGRSAPKRFVTVGRYGALTPDEARQKAREILASAAKGGDPAAARERFRTAMSVSTLADAFLAEHVETKRKPATAAQYRHVLSLVRPEFGSRKAEEITKSDVMRLHHKLRSTPFLANRLVAVLGSMFGWAAQHRHVPEGFNPASRIEKYQEDRRERFLSLDELDRLGNVMREAETAGLSWSPDETKAKAKHAPRPEKRKVIVSPAATSAIRLLLLTGARLREILHLRWDYVDLERGVLLLPDSKTGRKTIILNAASMAIVADQPRTGGFVFPGEPRRAVLGKADGRRGTRLDERPRSDLKRPWSAISKAAGLDGVRLHDLRHTHASFGASAGLGLPIIGKLLGHTQAATTARYAHLDNDPLRRASDRVGETISAALDGRTTRNVVKLKR